MPTQAYARPTAYCLLSWFPRARVCCTSPYQCPLSPPAAPDPLGRLMRVSCGPRCPRPAGKIVFVDRDPPRALDVHVPTQQPLLVVAAARLPGLPVGVEESRGVGVPRLPVLVGPQITKRPES